MQKWQNDYMREESKKLLQKQNYKDSLDKATDYLFNIAYEKYIIDVNFKNVTSFKEPDLDELCDLIKNDKDKFYRITYNEYKWVDYEEPIRRSDLKESLKAKHASFMTTKEKIVVIGGLTTVGLIVCGFIYGVIKLLCFLISV